MERTNDDAVLVNKSNKKKIFRYVFFILINVAVIVGMLVFEDKSGDRMVGKEAFSLLLKNPFYTVLAISMFFCFVVSDVIVFRSLTKKIDSNCRLSVCVNVSFLGRYYDRVTPWAMGGEPFQIFYLGKNGLSTGDSCAVTMSRHIIRFFSVAIIVIVILAASGIATNVYVMIAAILSLFAGLIIPIFMLICAFKPNIGYKIGNVVIGILYKIKIVKNREKANETMHKNVEEFLTGVRFLSANKSLIVIIGICSIVELFANNSVPFFVMKALGVTGIDYWSIFVLCIFVNYSSSFAPTPGGAGIAELSFYAIFAAHIDGGLLFWAVLFWRICIFYIPVFIGFSMTVADSVKNIVSLSKTRRKES